MSSIGAAQGRLFIPPLQLWFLPPLLIVLAPCGEQQSMKSNKTRARDQGEEEDSHWGPNQQSGLITPTSSLGKDGKECSSMRRPGP